MMCISEEVSYGITFLHQLKIVKLKVNGFQVKLKKLGNINCTYGVYHWEAFF